PKPSVYGAARSVRRSIDTTGPRNGGCMMSAKNVPHNSQYNPETARNPGSVNCVHGSEHVRLLVVELRALGVVLSVDGDGRLIFDAPAGVMTDERLAQLRSDRDAVLALVERFEERAAIIEHDGRLNRADAERLAWSEIDEPDSSKSEPSGGMFVHCKRSRFDVYIGRPSKWGNPFVIGRDGDRATVIEKYRAWIIKQPELMSALPELRGKVLGCHCAPADCHGDVLMMLANGVIDPEPEPVLMPEGVHCSFCRGRSFIDDRRGCRCVGCGRLSWVTLPNGSIVRADFANVALHSFPSDR
ncbi:MAG: DUF4326 domain-containing protein, partial [Pirellulaceae bacterium]|nr:DUF4326 domain-containing protein [Pirellulaceae bacterium]